MSLTRRGSCILSAIIFALLCLFILSPTGHCETKFPPGYKPAILKIVNLDISQYPKVSCEILFNDYSGRTIPLDESISLRLFEDEIPMTDVVRESRQTVATQLLIDTSGSMSGKMEHVAKGVEAYLNRIGPDDRVMVMEFNSWRGETPVVQKFTNDADSILGRIRKLKPRGQTALYDAIADGGDWFYPKFAKATKIMIVLSDGGDNNSVREWFNAMDFAKEHDIKVFFIALGPDADVRMFRRIARETGGEVFTSLKEEMLPTAYESISMLVRSTRTVLTYETNPDITADGRP
ncbi:VWA domain-containing protein, partial [bacterium]|nr:VWA domain-containing protein [bacterium]